jgi:hypothetical protein
MAQIPGAQGLGQAVARPLNFNETQTPREAFGGGVFRTIEGIGADMAAQEARERALAEAERKAADKAQAMGAMQRAQDDLLMLGDEMGQGIASGQIDKTKAGEEWATKAKERIAAGLEGVPASHRAAVQADLDHRMAGLSRTVIGKAIRVRDREDVKSGIAQTMEYGQRLYRSDAKAADALVSSTLDQLGPFGGLGADDIVKMKQGWREGAQFTVGYEAVSAGRDDRKALDKAEAIIKGLPDLDPQKRATLLDRASAYRIAIDQRAELAAQRADRDRDRALRRAEHEFNAFQALADKGTVLDPAYIDRVSQATAGTPYSAAIRGLAEQARATGGLASQPVARQQAMLDQINTEIAQRGRSPELDKRKEQIEKVLRGSQADIERDPLRAGLERGVIDALPPLNLASGLPGLVPQLAERVIAAQRVQQWAGRPVSPLTGDEAAAVKTQLDTLPVKERSALVAGIAGALGPQQAQGLAAQMDKKDKALALALAAAGARTTEGRFTSELILRGQQAKADGTSTKGEKQPDVKASAWRAHAAAELDGVFGNAAYTAQVRDAAELVMHGMAAEAGGRLSSDDMERAVRIAVGGSIVEHNGRRIPLPAGMDEAALTTRLGAVSADELGRQAPGGTVRAGGVPMPVAEFVKALPGQQLMPVRPGEFAVLVGGRPVVNADGVPIVIKVR